MNPSGGQNGTKAQDSLFDEGQLNAVSNTGALQPAGTLDGDQSASMASEEAAMKERFEAAMGTKSRNRLLKFGMLGAVLVIGLALVTFRQLHGGNSSNNAQADASLRYRNVSIPLADLTANSPALSVQKAQTLSINGQLNVNNSLILTPTTRPDGAVTGQLYYDQATNRLAYYDGSSFQTVLSGDNIAATTVGGAGGAVATGSGLTVAGNTLSNSGVLTLQGQAGNITLAAGPGIVVNGTTISNSGLLSLGGQNGDIAVGTGLDISVGTLHNTGIISAIGTGDISVSNDGNGNITISSAGGAGSGTVASPGGTNGKIAKFTGVQTIADSLISDNGTTVTVGGNLSVTGSVALTTPLAVTSGGTGSANVAGARTNLGAAASGANSDITSLSGLTTALTVAQGGVGVGTLATNGILIGNGTSPLTSLVAGSAGQCLVSTAGSPAWSPCPGAGGVTSLNGGNGALTLNNASLVGSAITINDATTAAKGIASFNGTNFMVTAGAVNTIQDINTTAAPTFGQLTVTSSQAANAMMVINNTNPAATGNLIDLKLNGSSKFSVAPSGNTTIAGTLTSGLINGQTISAAANFTGSVTVGTTLAVSTITPTSSLTVGSTNQSFLLQGNGSSTITSTANGHKATLGFTGGSPTTDPIYQLDASAPTNTYTICTTAGNCVGVGGSVSGSGTNNHIAKFTATGSTIGDSSISDDGSNVTLNTNVNLVLQGSSAYISNGQNTFFGEAFGGGAVASNGSVAVGYQASTFDNGVAVGYQAQSTSSGGVAVGSRSTSGFSDTAIGTDSTATATGSTALGNAANATNNYSIALGFVATTTTTNQFVVGGDDGSPSHNGAITQAVIGNGVTNAAPIGFMLQGSSGSGSNVSGASVTLAGGQGTGTGNGGDIDFQIAKPGATGSSLNPLVTVEALSGVDGSATFKNATNSTTAFRVQNASSVNILQIDTANARVGINTAGAPTSTLEITGTLRIDGSVTESFHTPGSNGDGSNGSDVPTKINIPFFDPGNFGQIIALGLPSAASSSARAITVLDARTGIHQASIAVLDTSENQQIGLSWDGDNCSTNINCTPVVKSTSDRIGLQAGGSTTAVLYNTSTTTNLTVGIAGARTGMVTLTNNTNGQTATLKSGVTVNSYVAILPTNVGSAGQCLSVSSVASQVETLDYTSCGGGGNAFLQGGNAFSATAVLGTTDNNALTFITNNDTQATIAAGGATTFKNSSDSANAFRVQSTGSANILNVNTTSSGASVAITTAAASNIGLRLQGASAQTGDYLQVQDSTGANILNVDSAANLESIGYFDNGIGGIGQFQNLLTYSEQLDNGAVWIANAESTHADWPTANPAPDGQSTADLVGTVSNGGSLAQTTSTAATSNKYTFSFWAKYSGGGTQSLEARIDGSTSGTGTAKGFVATSTWQRFSVTQDATGFTGNIKVTIFPGTTGGSGSIGVWGTQLVLGSSPQVYVRTTASAIGANQGVVSNGAIWTNALNASDVPLVVMGALSQSADLLRVENSSGTVLTRIDQNGSLYLQGTNTYLSNPQGQTNSEALGLNADVIGSHDATAVGAGTGSSTYGVALGATAQAGDASIAIGSGANASGANAFAFGKSSSAAFDSSIAIGVDSATTASNQVVIGSNSHAMTQLILGNGATSTSPVGFTLQATSTLAGTNNIAGADLNVAGGQGTGTAAGGSINFQIAKPGTTGGSQNALSTVASLSGANGSALFKNAADSTTAFQIQNAAGTSNVLDVDTANGRVGIGTNAPSRPLDIVTNNNITNAPSIKLEQQGTGDTSIELKDANGKSFFVGMDQSSGGTFKIASSTSAASSFTVGQTSLGGSVASGYSSEAFIYKVATGATGGTATSVTFYVSTVDGSNPHAKVALYTHDAANNRPGNLIASSGSQTLSVGYNTIPISAAVSASTTYWIGVTPEGNSTSFNYIFNSGSASPTAYYAVTYSGSWPSPAGSPFATDNSKDWTLYLNVTPSGAIDSFNGTSLFSLTDTGALALQNTANSTTAFQVQNASGYNVLGADTSSGVIVAGTASQIDGAIKFYSATGTGSVTLNLSNGASSGNYTLNIPGISASDTICLQTAGNCSIGGGSGANTALSNLAGVAINTDLQFQQGATRTINIAQASSGTGNQLTVAAGKGTSGQVGGNLVLQGGANGTASGTAGSVIVKANGGDTTTAFQVQNASAISFFSVDTTNERVYVGPTAGDTTGAILVLGNKTNSSDPATAVNGAIYYNSGGTGGAAGSTWGGKFRCFEGNVWKDCIGIRDITERRWGYANTGSTTSQSMASYGMDARNSVANSVASSLQAESHYVQFSTSTTSGNAAGTLGADVGSYIDTESRYLPKLSTRIRVDGTSVGSSRYWAGMFSASPTGFSVPTTSAAQAVSYIGLGYSSSVNSGKWLCASGDGSNNSGTDMGISVTAGHYYDITVDLSTAGTLVCSVSDNGGAWTTVTKTTNLPATSTDLGVVDAVTNTLSSVRSIYISYIYLEQN